MIMQRLTRNLVLTRGKKYAYKYLRGCGYSPIKALALIIKSNKKVRGAKYEYL